MEPFDIVTIRDAHGKGSLNCLCDQTLNGRRVLLLKHLPPFDWYVSFDLTRTTPKSGLYDYDRIVHVQNLEP